MIPPQGTKFVHNLICMRVPFFFKFVRWMERKRKDGNTNLREESPVIIANDTVSNPQAMEVSHNSLGSIWISIVCKEHSSVTH